LKRLKRLRNLTASIFIAGRAALFPKGKDSSKVSKWHDHVGGAAVNIAEFHKHRCDFQPLSLADQLSEMGRWKFLSMLLFLALTMVGCAPNEKLEPVNQPNKQTPDLDFGEVLVGDTSDNQMAKWKNSTQKQVRVDNLKIDKAVFVLDGGFSSLALGTGELRKEIKFVPTELKDYKGTVTPKGKGTGTESGSDGKPITLKGKGVAQITTPNQLSFDTTPGTGSDIVLEQILDFGAVQVNAAQGKVKKFKLKNDSGVQLTVSAEVSPRIYAYCTCSQHRAGIR
jgi:hypothetical protein